MMEEENLTFGTALDHFAESEELRSLVDALPHICQDTIALEASHERFTGLQIPTPIWQELASHPFHAHSSYP